MTYPSGLLNHALEYGRAKPITKTCGRCKVLIRNTRRYCLPCSADVRDETNKARRCKRTDGSTGDGQ